jgi:hypothetical protein
MKFIFLPFFILSIYGFSQEITVSGKAPQNMYSSGKIYYALNDNDFNSDLFLQMDANSKYILELKNESKSIDQIHFSNYPDPDPLTDESCTQTLQIDAVLESEFYSKDTLIRLSHDIMLSRDCEGEFEIADIRANGEELKFLMEYELTYEGNVIDVAFEDNWTFKGKLKTPTSTGITDLSGSWSFSARTNELILRMGIYSNPNFGLCTIQRQKVKFSIEEKTGQLKFKGIETNSTLKVK